MSIIRTVIVAASFVVVAAAANAQGREELNSGIHGNTSATVLSGSSISAEARGAFARTGGTSVRMHDANPLVDNFHGN
jgi:hypothetical protein